MQTSPPLQAEIVVETPGRMALNDKTPDKSPVPTERFRRRILCSLTTKSFNCSDMAYALDSSAVVHSVLQNRRDERRVTVFVFCLPRTGIKS